MKKLLVLAAPLFLGACVSITPEGKGVMLYQQNSTLLAGCKRLGPVSSEVPLITRATKEAGVQQAVNNLRTQAYQQYGADSVVVLTAGANATTAGAEGLAMQCGS